MPTPGGDIFYLNNTIKKETACPAHHGNIAENSVEDISSCFGAKKLLEMVQQLPPSYRMVSNLYVFEGMKHREIAEHLSISEGKSKSNLSVARGILQNLVNDSQVQKLNYIN